MQVIGACGLKCSECQAFKTTQANDLEKLAELAKSWGSAENPYTVKDMHCNGCMSGRVYKGCTTRGVRNCALEHEVANCGGCSEFTCEKITGLWTGYKLNPADMMQNMGKPQ